LTIPEALAAAREHHYAGRLQEAERVYRLILAQAPRQPEALRLLGVIAYQAGHYATAAELIQQSLGIEPRCAESYSNLGLALEAQGKLEEAVNAYHQALALDAQHPQSHNNLGITLQAQGKLPEAIDSYNRAISLRPDFADAYNNLGSALQAQGRCLEAIDCHTTAIALRPEYAQAHYNIGLAFAAQDRYPDAANAYRKALSFHPRYAEAYNNLGIAEQSQGHLDQAIAAYHEALVIRPEHAETYNNMAMALQADGRLSEALTHFDRAVLLKPDYVDGHVNRAHCRLLAGDLPGGFTEYEWRWQRKDAVPRGLSQPAWDGSSLAGRRILLHAEQGSGDTIQFVRFAPQVAAHGGRVFLECDPLLTRLLATVRGIDQVIPKGGALPEFDVQLPLLSLPRVLRTTLDTIPAHVPYLSAPPSGHRLLPSSNTLRKIGIVWAGRAEHGNDRNRSCPISHLRRLGELPGMSFYSLQKGPQAAVLGELRGDLMVEDLGQKLTDFADTAFIIAQLDVVITVDTAVAHLAGALGRPVWVMLPFACDWRWLTGRNDSPWYPTMRLFRQPRWGDWATVLRNVEQELENLLKAAQ
jgi:tetratricopeptide (TPR) repeat protein